jgi:hypothetical protein
MTDAAHNQHSETRRPSDRDRIVTTGPAVSSPPVQRCCAEMMFVVGCGDPEKSLSDKTATLQRAQPFPARPDVAVGCGDPEKSFSDNK